MGRESKGKKKGDIYIYITESLCYITEMQHCKSTIFR